MFQSWGFLERLAKIGNVNEARFGLNAQLHGEPNQLRHFAAFISLKIVLF
mgnify:CR=1 FL=1